MHMLTLKEAVTAFQTEISGAVAGLAAGWQTERVTLTLEVVSDAHGALRVAGPAAEGGRGHRVCIEFRVGPAGLNSAGATGLPGLANPGATPASVPSGAASAVTAPSGITGLLGAPGFDSSARAAVLCEVLLGLSGDQVAALPDAMLRPAAEVADPDLRRARHLILGIVQSGPLKSAERAAELLRSILRTMSPSALVASVKSAWDTEENW